MGERDLFSGIPTWDYMSLQTTFILEMDLSTTETEGQSKSPKTAWWRSSQVLPYTRNIYLLRTHSWTETAPNGPSFKQGVDSSSLKIPPFNTPKYTHTCARGNFAVVICDFYFFWGDNIRGTYWVAVCISEKTRTTRGGFITSLLMMNQNHLEFTSRTVHVWILAPAPEYCQNGLRVLERVNLSKDL